MIQVLIISDIRLFREGLADALTLDGRLRVVRTSNSIDESIEMASALDFDVILFDAAMGDTDSRIRALRRGFPRVKVITLSVTEDSSEILQYAEAGACGYVRREDSLDELVQRVESAVNGEFRCSKIIAGALAERVAALAAQVADSEQICTLTTREIEVAKLIDEGLTNKEIASRLRIEIPTAKNHVHNIFEKLRVHHRGEAAAKLRKAGMLK